MAFFGLFRGNPLKNIRLDKLKDNERILKLKSTQLTVDIDKTEKKIQALFEQSKTVAKGSRQQLTLANSIKLLTTEKAKKVEAHTEIERQLAAVTNLIITAEHEKDLRETGVWDTLQKLPPEVLEKYLINLQLDKKERVDRIKAITQMTEDALRPTENLEEGLEDILAVMDAIKEGSMTPETAQVRVTEERVLEGEIPEGPTAPVGAVREPPAPEPASAVGAVREPPAPESQEAAQAPAPESRIGQAAPAPAATETRPAENQAEESGKPAGTP